MGCLRLYDFSAEAIFWREWENSKQSLNFEGETKIKSLLYEKTAYLILHDRGLDGLVRSHSAKDD